jgi:isopropylmalate/homocitrate/citramalate synthase
MYGVDVGLKYDKLTPLANLVQKLTGVDVPSNKPVVGRQLYQIESGIIASWYKNCGEENATELFPVRANFVGQPPAEVVMGKGSGIDSVKAWLGDMGIEASDEEALKMTAQVKSYSLKTKKLLTEAEFRKIAQDVVGRRAAA